MTELFLTIVNNQWGLLIFQYFKVLNFVLLKFCIYNTVEMCILIKYSLNIHILFELFLERTSAKFTIFWFLFFVLAL